MNDPERQALFDWLRNIAGLIREVFEWLVGIGRIIAAEFAELRAEIKHDLAIGVMVLVLVFLAHGFLTRPRQ